MLDTRSEYMKREQELKFVSEQFPTKTAKDYNTAKNCFLAGMDFFGRRHNKFNDKEKEIEVDNLKLAIECLQKACDLERNNDIYLHNLASALEIQGNYEIAYKYYKSAYVLNSSEVQYNRDLAHISYKLKRYHEAKEYFISTIKLERLAIDYYNLGIMFFNKGNYEEARSSIEEAVKQVTVVIEKHISSKRKKFSTDVGLEPKEYFEYYTKVSCHLALSNIFYLQNKFNESEKEALNAIACNSKAYLIIKNIITCNIPKVDIMKIQHHENTCYAMELLCKISSKQGKHEEVEEYKRTIEDIKVREIKPLEIKLSGYSSVSALEFVRKKYNPNEKVVCKNSDILISRRIEMNIEEMSQPQELLEEGKELEDEQLEEEKEPEEEYLKAGLDPSKKGLKEVSDPDKKLPKLNENLGRKAIQKDLLKTLEIGEFLNVVEKSLDDCDPAIQLMFASQKSRLAEYYRKEYYKNNNIESEEIITTKSLDMGFEKYIKQTKHSSTNVELAKQIKELLSKMHDDIYLSIEELVYLTTTYCRENKISDLNRALMIVQTPIIDKCFDIIDRSLSQDTELSKEKYLEKKIEHTKDSIKEIPNPDKLPEVNEISERKITIEDLSKTLYIQDFLDLVVKLLDNDTKIQLNFISNKTKLVDYYWEEYCKNNNIELEEIVATKHHKNQIEKIDSSIENLLDITRIFCKENELSDLRSTLIIMEPDVIKNCLKRIYCFPLQDNNEFSIEDLSKTLLIEDFFDVVETLLDDFPKMQLSFLSEKARLLEYYHENNNIKSESAVLNTCPEDQIEKIDLSIEDLLDITRLCCKENKLSDLRSKLIIIEPDIINDCLYTISNYLPRDTELSGGLSDTLCKYDFSICPIL